MHRLRPVHRTSKLRRPLSLPRLPPHVSSPRSDSLRQELEALWIQEAVPVWHQEAYIAYLNSLPAAMAASIVRKELVDLQSQRASIQTTTTAIQHREALLTQFKVHKVQSVDLLQRLQKASVEVVESVTRWRKCLGPQLPFLYAGSNYLLKMKTDIPRDPLLVRALRKSAGALRARAQDAELVIVQEFEPFSPCLPQETPISLIPNPCLNAIIDESSTLPDFSVQNSPYLQVISSLLLEDLLSLVISHTTPRICRKACRAYIHAHLLLYSNTILESVIAATLKKEIKSCVEEAYCEEVDRDFIPFAQEIVENVVNSEVQAGVQKWTNEHIADLIGVRCISQLQIADIVQECIEEEKSLNNTLLFCIFHSLLDAYLSEDWLEILCEDSVSEEVLIVQLDQLPSALFRQVCRVNSSLLRARLAEGCYSELLAQSAGGVWCRKAVEETLLEVRGETAREDVFSVVTERRPVRRLTQSRNRG